MQLENYYLLIKVCFLMKASLVFKISLPTKNICQKEKLLMLLNQ